MIVGLCGSHGTGKSTVVQEARARGIRVSDVQLSREAQEQLGWDSLSKAQDSLEDMWLLQNAVLTAMLRRDEQLLDDGREVTLVERTPADAWAYTSLWLTRLGLDPALDPEAVIYRKTLESHAAQCYSSLVVLPIRAEIPFVAEARRADLDSRDFIDRKVRAFIRDNALPHYTLKALAPNHRGTELESYLTFLKEQQ